MKKNTDSLFTLMFVLLLLYLIELLITGFTVISLFLIGLLFYIYVSVLHKQRYYIKNNYLLKEYTFYLLIMIAVFFVIPFHEKISTSIGNTLSLVALIISFLFGYLSVFIAVYISNVERKKRYRELLDCFFQIKTHLNLLLRHYEYMNEEKDYHILAVTRLSEKDYFAMNETDRKKLFDEENRKYNLKYINKAWEDIYEIIREMSSTFKQVPDHIMHYEDIGVNGWYKSKDYEGVKKGVEIQVRWYDLVLEENGIYGFGDYFQTNHTRFDLMFRRNLFGLVNGVILIKDLHLGGKMITTKNKTRLIKEAELSMDNPGDYNLKERLFESYKRNYSEKFYDPKTKEFTLKKPLQKKD